MVILISCLLLFFNLIAKVSELKVNGEGATSRLFSALRVGLVGDVFRGAAIVSDLWGSSCR